MTMHDGKFARQIGDVLGDECVAYLRQASKDYPMPMPIQGAPAMAYRGEFIPRVAGGSFASFSDLIAEATAGKRQSLPFQKVGTASVLGRGSTLWTVGVHPAVGATPAALPDGDVCNRTTVGALGQTDPAGGDTQHLTTQSAICNVGPNILVVCDRLWHGRPSISTTAAQPVTGVPTRYQGTDAAGTIAQIEVATVLPATAHNWTDLTYVNQDGTTGKVAPNITGVSAAAVNTLDMTSLWFAPLAAGDTGIRKITSITLSATLASGALNLALVRPLMFIPLFAANTPSVVDGINSALSLAEVKTGACLSWFIIPGVASAATFTGNHEMVSG